MYSIYIPVNIYMYINCIYAHVYNIYLHVYQLIIVSVKLTYLCVYTYVRIRHYGLSITHLPWVMQSQVRFRVSTMDKVFVDCVDVTKRYNFGTSVNC